MVNETKTLTISEFLRERLHEAELTVPTMDCRCEAEPEYLPDRQSDELRHDCAEFVLEDIMSKRAIVDLHAAWKNRLGYLVCDECSADSDPYIDQVPYPCATLRLLAAPYRDHPDWREEWA